MPGLEFFGPAFSELTYEEAEAKIRNTRKLRRMRLPEKVRKAPKATTKTTTKKQKVSASKAFANMNPEIKRALLEAQLAKREKLLNGTSEEKV